jgi:hypothetical protein
VKEYYDVIHIVYIHSEKIYGSVEKLGAYASIVKYKKNEEELEELMENEDFTIMEEIIFKHIEEQD